MASSGPEIKEIKKKQRMALLKGLTPRCPICNKNRMSTIEDTFCYQCGEDAKTADLRAEMKKASPNWYIYWAPYAGFVCRECGTIIEAADEESNGTLPAIVACPNTDKCKSGSAYWGKGNTEPQHNLDLLVAEANEEKATKAAKEAKEAAVLPPEVEIPVVETPIAEPPVENVSNAKIPPVVDEKRPLATGSRSRPIARAQAKKK